MKYVLDKTKFLGVILIGTNRMRYNLDQWGHVKGTKQSICSRNVSLEAFGMKPVVPSRPSWFCVIETAEREIASVMTVDSVVDRN
jgi:hypothetical protein